MSKIFKASRISVDEFNKVLIKNDKVIQKQTPKKIVEEEPDIEELLKSAKEEAEKIIQEANNERENIISSAEDLKEDLISKFEQEGYDKGYKNGFDEGVEAGEKTYGDLNAEVAEKIQEYEKNIQELFDSCEKDVVDLIIDIVENLTTNLFKINPQLVQVLVKKGLKSATIQNKVSIKVSDEDYDYVLEHKDELTKYLDSSKEIEILKDFSLMKNDCMLETEFGNIDCGLDQQLNSIKESIYCIFKNR